MSRKPINGKMLFSHAGIALLCLFISFNVFFFGNYPVLEVIIQIILTALVLILYWGYFYLDFYNKAKVDIVNKEYDQMYQLRCNTLLLLVTMGIYLFQLFLPENYMNLVFNFWMSPYVFIYSWVGQNIFVKLVSIFILPFFCWLGYRTARSGNNLFKKLSDKLLVLVYQKK